MPRRSNAPIRPNRHTNSEKHRGTGSHKENVRSGYHESLDEIEYLRAGGKTIPDRPDLEDMSTPGTFRTYSHNDEQDGDNDFDSSYGDDQKMYNDRGAENRFLSGEDEASDYSSVPEQGAGRIGKIEKETAEPLASSKNDRQAK